MADLRDGGAMRQQSSLTSAQERVFDGGGSHGTAGMAVPVFDNDFDHGSYLALIGAGINPPPPPPPPPPPWAAEEMTAPVMNPPPPLFPMGTYGLSYQQPWHSYPYFHAESAPPWHPQAASSSVQATGFTVHVLSNGQMQPASLDQQHSGIGMFNRSQTAQVVIEQPAKDGYNWRKYGQKQLKDAESPRSYYKCTHEGCPVKKMIERSSDGYIKEITYKGQHNHPSPRKTRCGRADLATDENVQDRIGVEPSDIQEVATAEDALHEEDTETDHERGNADTEAMESATQRIVKKSKIIIQTPSEVDLLDDGYRWRKYGQKVVKGNPRPRSYYKCTTEKCIVRKQIERAATDPKFILTTYTGRHNHDPPVRTSGTETAATNMLQRVASNTNSSSADQISVNISSNDDVRRSGGTLQLKEENWD